MDDGRADYTDKQKGAGDEAIQKYLLANIKTPPLRVAKCIKDFIAPATFRALYPDAQSFSDAHLVPRANPIIIRLLWDNCIELMPWHERPKPGVSA